MSSTSVWSAELGANSAEGKSELKFFFLFHARLKFVPPSSEAQHSEALRSDTSQAATAEIVPKASTSSAKVAKVAKPSTSKPAYTYEAPLMLPAPRGISETFIAMIDRRLSFKMNMRAFGKTVDEIVKDIDQ